MFIYIQVYTHINHEYIHIYAMYVPGAHGGQKRALDIQELELQKIVSCPVGSRNETGRQQG